MGAATGAEPIAAPKEAPKKMPAGKKADAGTQLDLTPVATPQGIENDTRIPF